MLKTIAFSFAVALAVPVVTSGPDVRPSHVSNDPNGFNDKMLILHNGREQCVDWWAWPGHMIQHGDTLLGSCDVP